MSVIAFDAAATSALELEQRHPTMIPIVCVAAGSSKKPYQALLVPCSATVSELQSLLREALGTKKTVHVFIGDATPAGETAIADLRCSYASCGMLRVAYTLEGKYGAVNVGLAICGASVVV